jgi:hypothetical protein
MFIDFCFVYLWRSKMKLEKDFVIAAGTEVPSHFELQVKYILGAKIEYFDLTNNEWSCALTPTWAAEYQYREALTPPSINWEHLHEDYVQIAVDRDGEGYGYREVALGTDNEEFFVKQGPNAYLDYVYLGAFTSFTRGTRDWKDSLVLRPSYAEKLEAELEAEKRFMDLASTSEQLPALAQPRTLHPFNLEEALAGAQVVTREGIPVVGLYDSKDNSCYPLEMLGQHGVLADQSWTLAGTETIGLGPCPYDLFMVNAAD